MIDAQPPSESMILEGDDPVYIWFTPTGSPPGYICHIEHTTTLCCCEFYIPNPPYIGDDWDHWAVTPMNLFNDMHLRYWWPIGDGTQYPGWAMVGTSYQLGGMYDQYNGPMGIWFDQTPPDSELDFAQISWQYPELYCWSGITPNTPVDTTWWFTCKGDFDGNGIVNVNDHLFMLGHWGGHTNANGDRIYTVNHFLEILAAWGTSCP
jgi:hypothetical protein